VETPQFISQRKQENLYVHTAGISMMKQDKEPKQNDNVILIAKVGKEIGTDEFGRVVIKTFWKRIDRELNLGSINNPNPKILEIRYILNKNNHRGFGFFNEDDDDHIEFFGK
jgi:hypothetical protein